MLFCYLLIDQISELSGNIIDPRPISYYTNYIYMIVFTSNIISGACRIVESILLLVFRKILLKIEKRLSNENMNSFIDNKHEEEINMNSYSNSVIKDRDTNASQGTPIKIENTSDYNNMKEENLEVKNINFVNSCLI